MRESLYSNTLSKTQRDVAVLVAEGLTNSEIAARLNYSPKTVKSYLYIIFQKLNIANRAALAAYAITHDLRGDIVADYQQEETVTDPDVYRELISAYI